jgi:hypothetical protein
MVAAACNFSRPAHRAPPISFSMPGASPDISITPSLVACLRDVKKNILSDSAPRSRN